MTATLARLPALLLCLVAASGAAFAGSHGLPAASPVTVRLEFVPAQTAPGGTVEGRVVFDVQPGYHLYGPEETISLPTAVRLTGPASVRFGELKFPVSRMADLAALGGRVALLEGEVAIRFAARVDAAAPPGPIGITATVDYQPCTDRICERPKEDVPVPGTLVVAAPASGAATGARSPAPEPAPPVAAGGVSLHAAPTGPSPARAGSPVTAGATGRAAPAPPAAPPGKRDPFKDALEKGLFWALLAAFGWGIAASFSPCVYPMIPITISYFGGQAKEAGTRKRVALATTYVLGMTVTYAVLGVLAARLGQDLGAWMVNPWVIGSLAVLLVALACSMFGLFVLQFPASLTNRINSSDRGGYVEAFVMGLALGFVAAPCVGPFAGSILVFVARSGSMLVGFATLFAFGMGMGVLFIAIAVSSGSLAMLPRSGQWLLVLEHFFGYVLIGMALYLLSNIWPPALTTWAVGVYLIAGGTFAGAFAPLAPDSAGREYLRKAAGVTLIAMGAAAVVSGTARSGLLGEWPRAAGGGDAAASGVAAHAGWLRSMDEGLAEARRSGKPIFADFYADWCIPCRLMDRTVFPDPAVARALEGFVRIKVDCTDPASPGARYKNEVLQAANMPYLAFFDPAGKHLPADSIEGYADKEAFLAAAKTVSDRYAAGR